MYTGWPEQPAPGVTEVIGLAGKDGTEAIYMSEFHGSSVVGISIATYSKRFEQHYADNSTTACPGF
ncbi:hypothetical protein [Paucidesulfovibrio gracilis]|uniref:hypothetical protein n=1 Tax=Paucidesulfovibrio gracilis TaxID=47158 RepID=UPI0009995B51|nr:hypothetical protein [Paucidesulfovibrio gracilis]